MHRDLPNTAFVCQDFTDPALGTLWRHLYEILPLISILPKAILVQVWCVEPYPDLQNFPPK
jgi:hypothetical protein